MADSPRIEELKRRVQSDPASIAFAALAEEYRRTGRFDEAIETCSTGLVRHPSYLSAHVTLGRAFIEVGRLQEARRELEFVLKLAPENLAAIRGLAEIHHRVGDESIEPAHETPVATASESTTPAPTVPSVALETELERPLTVPIKTRSEDKPEIQAPLAPVMVAANMAVADPPVAVEPHFEYRGPVDPALAGLEEFLNAIIRARAERASAR